jgi:hypothetical protein
MAKKKARCFVAAGLVCFAGVGFLCRRDACRRHPDQAAKEEGKEEAGQAQDGRENGAGVVGA